jgi:hypothetical protein
VRLCPCLAKKSSDFKVSGLRKMLVTHRYLAENSTRLEFWRSTGTKWRSVSASTNCRWPC